MADDTNKKKRTPFSFDTTPEMKTWITQLADKEGRSVSNYLHRYFKEMKEQSEAEPQH